MSAPPRRVPALALAAALMAAGVALRTVPRAEGWHLPLAVHHGGGGFLWGGMVYALVAAIRPSRWRIPACLTATLAMVAAVEGSRLVHAPALDAFRLTVAGQWLLGRVFAPSNIAVDGLGAGAAAAALRFLPRPPASTRET